MIVCDPGVAGQCGSPRTPNSHTSGRCLSTSTEATCRGRTLPKAFTPTSLPLGAPDYFEKLELKRKKVSTWQRRAGKSWF